MGGAVLNHLLFQGIDISKGLTSRPVTLTPSRERGFEVSEPFGSRVSFYYCRGF
jgi:hypothetical protein